VALLGVRPGDEELLLVPEHPEDEAVLVEGDVLERMVREKEVWGVAGEGRDQPWGGGHWLRRRRRRKGVLQVGRGRVMLVCWKRNL
jgi:hypothetical protein